MLQFSNEKFDVVLPRRSFGISSVSAGQIVEMLSVPRSDLKTADLRADRCTYRVVVFELEFHLAIKHKLANKKPRL